MKPSVFSAWVLASIFATGSLAQESGLGPYRVPECGIRFDLPRDMYVGNVGVYLPGVIGPSPFAPHHFGLLPDYSSCSLDGVAFRTDIRVFLLTTSIKTDEARAKRHGWTGSPRPTLDLYPFAERQQSNVVRAIEMLYLQRPTPWEEVKIIKVGERNAVEMSGWDRRIKSFHYFQKIRAVPLPGEKILLIHSHYSDLSKKQLTEQRQIVANLVKSLRFTP